MIHKALICKNWFTEVKTRIWNRINTNTAEFFFSLCIDKGCPFLVLEGHCPAEFSSNPDYGVCRVNLESSSAGRWPSRNRFGHPWTVSELDSSSLQAELESSLEESRQSARAAQESLSEKETGTERAAIAESFRTGIGVQRRPWGPETLPTGWDQHPDDPASRSSTQAREDLHWGVRCAWCCFMTVSTSFILKKCPSPGVPGAAGGFI